MSASDCRCAWLFFLCVCFFFFSSVCVLGVPWRSRVMTTTTTAATAATAAARRRTDTESESLLHGMASDDESDEDAREEVNGLYKYYEEQNALPWWRRRRDPMVHSLITRPPWAEIIRGLCFLFIGTALVTLGCLIYTSLCPPAPFLLLSTHHSRAMCTPQSLQTTCPSWSLVRASRSLWPAVFCSSRACM